MHQERSCALKASSFINPDVLTESRDTFDKCYLPNVIVRLICCGCILFLILFFHIDEIRSGFLILTGLTVVMYLIRWLRNRNGGAAFRKVLSRNNGIAPLILLGFDEHCIHLKNHDTGEVRDLPYPVIRSILESENLLILLLPRRRMLPIRKYSIQGGSYHTLTAFLHSHCPRLKGKVNKGRLGNAVRILYACMIIVGIVLALIGTYSAPVTAAKETTSYQQAAQKLESLGITGSTPELLEKLEGYYAEYAAYGYEIDRCLDLLCWLGAGEYDEETWEWTPSQNRVYWFDAEMLNLECMYTDFLRGVQALDPEVLNFSNIQEDISGVNWEQGTGVQTVSFDWQGASHTLRARVHNDWIDTSVADDLAKIIALTDTGKRLYFAFDGGQGYLVFFADAQWAEEFQAVTGITLRKKISQLSAIY